MVVLELDEAFFEGIAQAMADENNVVKFQKKPSKLEVNYFTMYLAPIIKQLQDNSYHLKKSENYSKAGFFDLNSLSYLKHLLAKEKEPLASIVFPITPFIGFIKYGEALKKLA